MPKVNRHVLIWARVSAGLSEEQAARKLGLSGPERLKELETGKRDPSRRQLLNISETYRRPLLTFYMQTPPRESDRGQDFRTLPESDAPSSEALLNALLRDVYARQGLVRAALEEAEEDEELRFVGCAKISNGVDALVETMQNALEFSPVDFRAQKTVSDAFAALRASTEKAGVFVLLMGNLGTSHSDIDPRVFRGFALSDPIAPFIVINENDSRAAWSFTLLHELAHVFLGETGISGYDGALESEKFCDAVAGRFLLDPAELAVIGTQKTVSSDELIKKIGKFAADRKLSRKMVAYNLLRSDQITRTVYRELSDLLDGERITRKAKKKDKDSGGGPDYYKVRRHRMGPRLVNVVQRMVFNGSLSTTKAGKVLGVKPTAVHRLIEGSRVA
ncbi:MAG: XRE family transcriptional regulator [Rhizobiaceae bacterium]